MFSLDKFNVASGRELHDYMEPLLKLPDLEVSEQDIQVLASRLAHQDEYHLVYSLLMLGRFAPDIAVVYLPQYAASDRDAVFCSVLNIIERLPERFISDDFQASIHQRAIAKSARPELLAFITKFSEQMRTKR